MAKLGGTVRAVLAVLAALAVSACATGRMIVLKGEPSSLARLAGEWDGTFSGVENGPHGSLWFSLVAGEDHAHGDVRMTPPSREPYGPFDPRDSRRSSETLTYLDIRWVRLEAYVLEGTLQPFRDDICGCRAETTFRGTLGDNRFDGTYITRLADGTVRTGRWRAVRTKAPRR